MHLPPLIYDLAVILGVAALVSVVFIRIRQPVVLGYLIAGLIVGPHTPPYSFISDLPNVQAWAEIGVIFLMFSLGLEFSFRKLSSVGVPAGATAAAEVLFMLAVGYGTGRALGWNAMDSVFLGAMLSISSTTIIIKALDDMKLKTRRFAEMIFGILIVEDLLAILLMVALTTFGTTQAISGTALLSATGQLIIVMGGWFISGYLLIPRFIRYIGKVGTNETLTITACALCLGLVSFAAFFHYSAALGAFIMGSILAESTESHRIENRIEPLRDLFSAVFFVSVGMLIDVQMIFENLPIVLLISLVTIVGKILIVSLTALVTGQSLRQAVQVGFGLAQIGEFSFIIAGLGMSLGVTSKFLYPIGVAVSLITTLTTPYLIRYSHRFAVALEKKLPPSLFRAINRYTSWVQQKRADAAGRAEFNLQLFRWLVSGIIISLFFTLSAHLLLPFLSRTFAGAPTAMNALAWSTALIVSTPFLWRMLVGFRSSRYLFRALSILWIAFLSIEFFPARYVLLLLIVVVFALLAWFYPRAEQTYRWLESQFMASLDSGEKTRAKLDVLKHLAPWDAHLVRIKVHPNSEFVQKRLLDTRIRSQFGVNVVAIQRGIKTLVAPKPEEVLLPKDEILVLGTDDQIEPVRNRLERPPGLEQRFDGLAEYSLSQVLIPEGSSMVGKTIRSAGIRETYDAMVVGLEREGRRMINPDSNLPLKAGDILWVVGLKEKVDAFTQQIQDSHSPA